MASNFTISKHDKKNRLYLDLKGDFDGSSAFELINAIESHSDKDKKVVVDTCGLSSLHPFGVDIFKKNHPIKNKSRDLAFIGIHKDTMIPEESDSL